MTFKHMKFEDSVTMRSLEKVAREKGWIQNSTPISKIALFDKTDLSISVNLTENIMKLCTGLRTSGLEKYAEEIENKFINYKKSQTLYEISKETGEDIIDNAHPEGSHKLSNIEGDNTIENIIDQHLASIKIIEKKPTGKLSSSQIINQVKVALGANFLVKFAATTSDQIAAYDTILNQVASTLNNIAKKIETTPEDQIGINWEDPKSVANTLKKWANVLTSAVATGVSNGNTKDLWLALNNIKNLKSQVQIFNDENADANRMVASMMSYVVNKLEQISWSLQHPDYMPSIEEYKGSTFSKAQQGHHWEAKYTIPEDKKDTIGLNVPEIKNILSAYAYQIQKNILDREDAIYQPIPDNDLGTISIMDQAFDRAENFKTQLNGLSDSLNGQTITPEQLNKNTNSFSMFRNRKFNNKSDLLDFINKIQKSIYNAVGIKS